MKIPTFNNAFQYIIGFTALFVASVAGFFSVAGIGMLFSGAYLSSVTMAISLETGKVVATSFLYRYWNKITIALKIYMICAVAMLMFITSVGVFGWLSSAYQSSAAEYAIVQQKTSALIEQRTAMQSELALSKQRIDLIFSIRGDQEKRMNDTLSNPILSRNPTQLRQVQEQNIEIIKKTDADLSDEKSKYSVAAAKVADIGDQILKSKSTSERTKDIATFKFVADAMNLDLNETVKWFILFIIVVFDPLAVSLVLAYNVVVSTNKKEENLVVKIPNQPTATSIEIAEETSEKILAPEEQKIISVPQNKSTDVPPPPAPLTQPHGPFSRDHKILNG